MVKFNDKSWPRSREDKNKKRITFDSVNAFCEGRELAINAYKSGIFPIKATRGEERPRMVASRPSDLARVAKVSDRTQLKILNSKQMLQRLSIALAQITQSFR